MSSLCRQHRAGKQEVPELCPGELPHVEVRQGKSKNQRLKRRTGEVKGLRCHGVQGESCLEAERDQLKVK